MANSLKRWSVSIVAPAPDFAQLAAVAKTAGVAMKSLEQAMAKVVPFDPNKNEESQEYLKGFEAATKKLQKETKAETKKYPLLMFSKPKVVNADPLPDLEEVEDFEAAGFFDDMPMVVKGPAKKKAPVKPPAAKPAPVTTKRKIILED